MATAVKEDRAAARSGPSGVGRWFARHRWISVGLVVVLAAAGAGIYVLVQPSDASTPSAATTSRLVSVSKGTIQQTVSTSGTFSPADERNVSFSSSAVITSVRVRVGDQVRKGQVLGTIDRVSLRSSLASAIADRATAKATLSYTRAGGHATSAQLRADRGSITTASAAVTSARQALRHATLRSPIAGTVADVNVAKGDESSGSDSSSSSSSTGSTTTVPTTTTTTSSSSSTGDFVVIGLKKWKVDATVDDTQVGHVSRGDQVQITTDNVDGTVFGTVSSVSVLSSSDSGSASYPVKIAVTGTPRGLHDGADATISIIYRQLSNVLTVPTLAVHTDSSGAYVYVSDNGTKTRKTITTGLSSGGETQVKSGLSSGDQVYEDVITGLPTTGSSGSTGSQTGQFPGGGTLPGGGSFPGIGSGGVPALGGGS